MVLLVELHQKKRSFFSSLLLEETLKKRTARRMVLFKKTLKNRSSSFLFWAAALWNTPNNSQRCSLLYSIAPFRRKWFVSEEPLKEKHHFYYFFCFGLTIRFKKRKQWFWKKRFFRNEPLFLKKKDARTTPEEPNNIVSSFLMFNRRSWSTAFLWAAALR